MRFKIRLTPQNKEFFVLYEKAASNAVEITRLLVELLDRFPEGSGELIVRIKEREHEGDDLTHSIVDLLNRTFVTPFDRDDMYRLASALDDIADHVDEAADNIGLYGVKVVPEEAKKQAGVILKSAVKLEEAISRLDGFKDVRPQLIELRSLEDEGDRLARDAIGGLFRSGQDAVSIIRWKDLHEQLEAAVDSCEYAADVLEAIVVKNR
jgi:predicted phosphate transport protein (TIGR00153 family)